MFKAGWDKGPPGPASAGLLVQERAEVSTQKITTDTRWSLLMGLGQPGGLYSLLLKFWNQLTNVSRNCDFFSKSIFLNWTQSPECLKHRVKQKEKKKKKSGPWGILEFAYLFSVLKTLFCFSFDKDKTLCNIRCSLCPEVCFKIKVEHWLLAAQSIMDHERRTKFLYCRLQKSVSFWTPNREQCTH